jgi:hypothetical protein
VPNYALAEVTFLRVNEADQPDRVVLGLRTTDADLLQWGVNYLNRLQSPASSGLLRLDISDEEVDYGCTISSAKAPGSLDYTAVWPIVRHLCASGWEPFASQNHSFRYRASPVVEAERIWSFRRTLEPVRFGSLPTVFPPRQK